MQNRLSLKLQFCGLPDVGSERIGDHIDRAARATRRGIFAKGCERNHGQTERGEGFFL
jgi:hypothetical protein